MRAYLSLHRATLAVHCVLIVAIVAAFGIGTWLRLVGSVALTAPLLLALPGLFRGSRYTHQWLAVVLVLYAGAASVEVVATAGNAAPALALLAALAELAQLLALIRAAPRVVRE